VGGSLSVLYCLAAHLLGKNSYGGCTGFHLFRAALIRNVKGEYDNGTIIQIDENTTGDEVVEEMFSKALVEFCKRAG
jgi:hypothetical protein